MAAVALTGCAGPSSMAQSQQEEGEFGSLTAAQVEAFERELRHQYSQLDVHYEDYDRVRQAGHQARGDFEEHRIHRKLIRRHQTLARLHEERMWLRKTDASQEEDKGMAELHRKAASWHEEHFKDDGEGVVGQDEELEALRRELTEERHVILDQ